MDVDDTLVIILERLASPVSLIRAASTCRRWRRVIADAGFLRRCRALHGPLVAGGYSSVHEAMIPSFVPSSSSSIDAGHFSLDFLVDASIFPPPPPGLYDYDTTSATPAWKVRESRGSLLLMECTHGMCRPGSLFADAVVCEPLTRRYKIIPPPPDLALDNDDRCVVWGPFLVDGDEDEAGGRIGMSNFRLQCVLFRHGVAHTTVFTAGGGHMDNDDSTWSDKAIDHAASKLDPSFVPWHSQWRFLGGALGSTYYYVHRDGTLVTRDCSTGEFSSSALSSAVRNCWDPYIERPWGLRRDFFVIDGGDGEPRVVAMKNLHKIEVFARLDGEWALEKKLLLSKVICGLPGYQPSFSNKPPTMVKRGVGFIVILLWETTQWWSFSIDLKTMEVAPAAEDGSADHEMAYRCEFPWPPVLQA